MVTGAKTSPAIPFFAAHLFSLLSPLIISPLSELSAKFQSYPDTVKAKTLCHMGFLVC